MKLVQCTIFDNSNSYDRCYELIHQFDCMIVYSNGHCFARSLDVNHHCYKTYFFYPPGKSVKPNENEEKKNREDGAHLKSNVYLIYLKPKM